MRWSAICLVWFLMAASSPGGGKPAKWMIGPFARPDHAQPVITARPESVFADPILGRPVHWEALHTFNPAAVVRDGKIYVLYRAEDDSGTMQIGMHTSRLGLAVSEDGEHFTREAAPVFYPQRTANRHASGRAARRIPGSSSRRMADMC